MTAAAHVGRQAEVVENRRDSAAVGVELDLRPRITRLAGVFRFNADEAAVAGTSLPKAVAGVIGAAGCNHKPGAVSARPGWASGPGSAAQSLARRAPVNEQIEAAESRHAVRRDRRCDGT